MKNFLQYAIPAALVALVVASTSGLLLGWALGMGTLAAFLAIVAIRDSWKLLTLEKWLHDHSPQDVLVPGNTWGRVFSQLYQLEKKSIETQRQLRDTLERFLHAGAALPTGVIILDATDRIIWCNPSAEAHLGIRLEQDRGQSLTYLVRQTEFNSYLRTAVENTPPLILHRVRGQNLTLSVQMIPYSPTERLLVSQDITRKERDERIRRDFVANVSHELRTPLTVVGGFIETLLDGNPLDNATRHRVLGTMQTQTLRMQRLVDELLTLSRLESQPEKASLTKVPVAALMQQLTQMARHLSQDRHEVLSMNVAVSDHILGNESELLSAFGNLVSNAVRYTPEGGKIILSWKTDSGEGVFSVADTGPGIEAEHLPRLTERFYRVDRARSRETGGTGLGLAIVKQIAIHHDAKLEVSSTPGQGSVFSLRIPRERVTFPLSSTEPLTTHAQPRN